METKFYVIKKSAGYSVKSFMNESKARRFAERCEAVNMVKDYAVCIYKEGGFKEV